MSTENFRQPPLLPLPLLLPHTFLPFLFHSAVVFVKPSLSFFLWSSFFFFPDSVLQVSVRHLEVFSRERLGFIGFWNWTELKAQTALTKKGKIQNVQTKMDIGTIETFLPEKNYETKTNESMMVRCIRKKYKCIIIFILSLTVLSQLFVVLLEKTDESVLNKILSYALKEENSTLVLIKELDQLINSTILPSP
jgi:hypothetical protein